jgi:arginine/lysine/histidine transport system ATP-binding protein
MLKVINLEKKFNQNVVLKDINLEINKGERVVIIGPSGSGKSTFLRCLNYLEKPTKGSIEFEGKTITKKNLNEIRKQMGMVFQSFNLFNNLSVIDNITLAPIKTGLLTKDEANKEAIKLLKRIDLLSKKDAYPDDLSGGQKQRIAIIRSLIMKPKIMLFDEPTSALDPEMIGEVLEIIKEVANEGMTMIIVTHELNFAREVATRVLFMADGKILADDVPDKIFNHPENERLKTFLTKL